MRPFSRFARAVFALWFALVLGDPGVLHSCPMHGSHAGHSAVTGHEPHAASHHAAAGEHGSQHQAPCTCVGSCCASAVAVPHVVAESLVVIADVEQPQLVVAWRQVVLPRAPDVRLPFPNGPPLV